MKRAAIVLLFIVACEKPSPATAPEQPGKLTGAPGEFLPAAPPGPTVEPFYVEVRNEGLLIENGEGMRTESKAETLCADLRSSRALLRYPYPADLPMAVSFRSHSSLETPAIVAAIKVLKGCGIKLVTVTASPENQSM